MVMDNQDRRENIEVDLTDEEFLSIAKMAHERDITLNKMVEYIIQQEIDRITAATNRIQELVKQATDTVEIFNPDTGITHHREFFDKEKFAELIVQECIDVISPYAVRMENFDGGHPITDLKKHFGVEE